VGPGMLLKHRTTHRLYQKVQPKRSVVVRLSNAAWESTVELYPCIENSDSNNNSWSYCVPDGVLGALVLTSTLSHFANEAESSLSSTSM
jgi:hypothetical protein